MSSSTTSANDVASAGNGKISLEEIKEICWAAKPGSNFFRRIEVSLGDRLAEARSLGLKATEEHVAADDGGVQLPVPAERHEPVVHISTPNDHPAFGNDPPVRLDASSDASHPRKLLAAPLRLVRSDSARPPQKLASLLFLNAICPVGGELSCESDVLVPTVVYTVTYMMTDREFALYRQIVRCCPMANEVEKMLGVGDAAFDWINEKTNTVGLFLEGKEMEEILQEEVMKHRLGFTWDLAKSAFDPYKAVV